MIIKNWAQPTQQVDYISIAVHGLGQIGIKLKTNFATYYNLQILGRKGEI